MRSKIYQSKAIINKKSTAECWDVAKKSIFDFFSHDPTLKTKSAVEKRGKIRKMNRKDTVRVPELMREKYEAKNKQPYTKTQQQFEVMYSTKIS